MRKYRNIFWLFAFVFLAAWAFLRPSYSPTQALSPVTFSAFQLKAVTPQAGQSVAEAAREWPGVTATAYNPKSDILAVSYTAATSEADIRSRIEGLLPYRIVKANFAIPAGPQCPVPAGLIRQIPLICLLAGAACGLCGLLFQFGIHRRLTA